MGEKEGPVTVMFDQLFPFSVRYPSLTGSCPTSIVPTGFVRFLFLFRIFFNKDPVLSLYVGFKNKMTCTLTKNLIIFLPTTLIDYKTF